MRIVLTYCLLWLAGAAWGQTSASLLSTIAHQDSLLFEVGFNTCDVAQFERLISDDFEFYHDQSGITGSKVEFVTGVREGLCKSPYHPSRQLVIGSMEVFPLYDAGKLYGAIQTGKHRFYEQAADGTANFRSIARFTHLWLLEGNEWRLKRGLSYDHQTHEGNKDGRK